MIFRYNESILTSLHNLNIFQDFVECDPAALSGSGRRGQLVKAPAYRAKVQIFFIALLRDRSSTHSEERCWIVFLRFQIFNLNMLQVTLYDGVRKSCFFSGWRGHDCIMASFSPMRCSGIHHLSYLSIISLIAWDCMRLLQSKLLACSCTFCVLLMSTIVYESPSHGILWCYLTSNDIIWWSNSHELLYHYTTVYCTIIVLIQYLENTTILLYTICNIKGGVVN